MTRKLTRREKAAVDERVRPHLQVLLSEYETQEMLASDLGVHPSMIRRYLDGISGMSEAVWLRVSELCQVSFERLTGLPREPEDVNDAIPERRIAVQAARMVGYSEEAIRAAMARPGINKGHRRTAAQWLELIAELDRVLGETGN